MTHVHLISTTAVDPPCISCSPTPALWRVEHVCNRRPGCWSWWVWGAGCGAASTSPLPPPRHAAIKSRISGYGRLAEDARFGGGGGHGANLCSCNCAGASQAQGEQQGAAATHVSAVAMAWWRRAALGAWVILLAATRHAVPGVTGRCKLMQLARVFPACQRPRACIMQMHDAPSCRSMRLQRAWVRCMHARTPPCTGIGSPRAACAHEACTAGG